MTPEATLWVFGDGALATATARGLSSLGVHVLRVGTIEAPGPWTWMAAPPRLNRVEPSSVVCVAETTSTLAARCQDVVASGRTVTLTVAPLHVPSRTDTPHLAVGALWGPDTPWVARLTDAVADRPHALWLPRLVGLRPTTPHVLAQAVLARCATPSDATWTLTGRSPHGLHDLGDLILRHAGHTTLRPRSAPAWATGLRYQLRTAVLREWIAAASVPNHTPGWEPDEVEARWDWVTPRIRTRRTTP
ncbi:MAG: hypothetical protein RLZZ383_1665 [Pseudomonadota bacterium]|jgi:hypothetical protein